MYEYILAIISDNIVYCRSWHDHVYDELLELANLISICRTFLRWKR